jgi:tetratricopeptide (TPR) repeat protein
MINVSKKKFLSVAIPIALGGLIFGLFTGLSSKKPPLGKPAARTQPPDNLHEMKALEVELKKKPEHVPILFRLAEISTEMNKPAEAAAYLRRILAQEPNNVEARLELGRALYSAGDVPGALEETNRILQKDPKQVDALYNLGAIYGNLNKDEIARQYWTRAVASDANSESGRRAAKSLEQLAKNDSR